MRTQIHLAYEHRAEVTSAMGARNIDYRGRWAKKWQQLPPGIHPCAKGIKPSLSSVWTPPHVQHATGPASAPPPARPAPVSQKRHGNEGVYKFPRSHRQYMGSTLPFGPSAA